MKKALNIDQQIAKLKSHGMEFDNEEKAKEICPNDDERMNIILDMTYGYKGNRQF